jgi:hypothetical protein
MCDFVCNLLAYVIFCPTRNCYRLHVPCDLLYDLVRATATKTAKRTRNRTPNRICKKVILVANRRYTKSHTKSHKIVRLTSPLVLGSHWTIVHEQYVHSWDRERELKVVASEWMSQHVCRRSLMTIELGCWAWPNGLYVRQICEHIIVAAFPRSKEQGLGKGYFKLILRTCRLRSTICVWKKGVSLMQPF